MKVYVGLDKAAHEVSRIKNIGQKAHGCVAWGNADDLIMLDSENGMLVSLNSRTGEEFELWKVGGMGGPRTHPHTHTLHTA